MRHVPPPSRVARNSSTERASGSACAIATKLYWPPTPETTRPSSSAIGHRRAERGRHHAGVEEARVATLQAFQRSLPPYSSLTSRRGVMPMPRRMSAVELAQPVVELRRAEVEGAVQELAVALQQRVVGVARAAASMRCISASSSTTRRWMHAAATRRMKPSLTISLAPYRPRSNGPAPPLARPADGAQPGSSACSTRAVRRRCRCGAAPARGTARRTARRCRSAACRHRAPARWRTSRSR